MPQDHQFEVYVKINGTRTEEYNTTTTLSLDNVPHTKCTIVSQSGANFSAHPSVINDDPKTAYMAKLSIDGTPTVMSGSKLTCTPQTLDIAIDGNVIRPYVFAPLRTVEGELELDANHDALVDADKVCDIGTIVVTIWAGTFQSRSHRDTYRPALNLKQAVLLETQKKAVSVSHSTTFGESMGTYTAPSYRGFPGKHVATFTFEYASQDVLEALNKIPMLAPPPGVDLEVLVKPSRDSLQNLRAVKAERFSSTQKRVVVLDHSDNEEKSASESRLSVGSSNMYQKQVVNLCDSDDE